MVTNWMKSTVSIAVLLQSLPAATELRFVTAIKLLRIWDANLTCIFWKEDWTCASRICNYKKNFFFKFNLLNWYVSFMALNEKMLSFFFLKQASTELLRTLLGE